MKKFILILFSSILLMLSSLSYAETRNAVDFNNFGPVNSLSVNGDFDINIKQGDKQTIRVEANSKQKQQIQVSYKKNQLTISCKSSSFWSKFDCLNDDAKLFLTVKDLHKINMNGKSVMKINSMHNNKLSINNNGNMKLLAQGQFEDLSIDNNGKAVMSFNGVANNFNLNSNGNIILNTEKMPANSFNSSTKGKAIMAVNVSKNLNISANGEVTLSYLGSPVITKTIHGKAIISPKS